MDKGLGDNGDRQRLVMVEISVVGPDRDFRRWLCVGVWENNKGKMKRKSQHKNEDKPSWLTHSKSISAQKIPTKSTLKPLENQTHKSRKIYKSTLKKKKNKTVWAKSDANKPRTVSRRSMPTMAADSPSRGSALTNLSSTELPGWVVGANLVSHRHSWRDLLVSLWASVPSGEEGWACELSGKECRVKRESNRGEGKMKREKMVGNASAGKLNRRTDQVTGMGPTKIRKVWVMRSWVMCAKRVWLENWGILSDEWLVMSDEWRKLNEEWWQKKSKQALRLYILF